jgi:DNA-binding transcriptional regulator YdaS (Cro superfamily)
MSEKVEVIAKAIKVVAGGRQQDLADAMNAASVPGLPKLNQQHISKLLNGEMPLSAEVALALHAATNGAVPGSEARPDLWTSPEHVPLAPSREGAPPEDGTADQSAVPSSPHPVPVS